MKKILILSITFLVIVLLFFKLEVFAIDACDRFIPKQSNFIWKVVIWSNLRDYPCTYKSSILWVSKIWDIYEIISKVDGWYQVKFDNNKIYWIWDKAIIKINDEVIKKEPLYILTSKDNILINKIVGKVNLSVQKKWLVYRNLLVNKVSEIIKKKKYSNRLMAVLNEIVYRISKLEVIKMVEEIKKQETIEIKSIKTNTYNLENIDVHKVKNTWLSWYNDVRKNIWVDIYSYDQRLESSSLDWSKVSKNRWDISHKRDLSDSYYDYNKITSRFKDRWVICKNIYKTTNTENIWYWIYKCSDWECTDELINAIKTTFDFYMWEKWTANDAHYRSIIHKYFTKIWLWIEIKNNGDWYYKYYLTVHYCTELLDY